jgi:hypothetical protein
MEDRRNQGFIVLDEKDWESMTETQRSWAVFKTIKLLHDRICFLEGRPFLDKFLVFCGGAIGGFCAALGLKFLGQ